MPLSVGCPMVLDVRPDYTDVGTACGAGVSAGAPQAAAPERDQDTGELFGEACPACMVVCGHGSSSDHTQPNSGTGSPQW